MAARIRKDDMVVVISGRDKGARGRVVRVLRETDQVVVEGVNKVRRHTRPTPKNREGGIIEREAPIHVAKVMLLDTKADAPTRVKFAKNADGKKVRVTVKTGTVVDG
jgi:large subunit ribosomal protein L24